MRGRRRRQPAPAKIPTVSTLSISSTALSRSLDGGSIRERDRKTECTKSAFAAFMLAMSTGSSTRQTARSFSAMRSARMMTLGASSGERITAWYAQMSSKTRVRSTSWW